MLSLVSFPFISFCCQIIFLIHFSRTYSSRAEICTLSHFFFYLESPFRKKQQILFALLIPGLLLRSFFFCFLSHFIATAIQWDIKVANQKIKKDAPNGIRLWANHKKNRIPDIKSKYIKSFVECFRYKF